MNSHHRYSLVLFLREKRQSFSIFFSYAAILLILICTTGIKAQEINPRDFDDKKVDELKEQLAHIYQNKVLDNTTWNEKLWNWVKELLMSFLNFLSDNLNLNINPAFFKIFFYVFAVCTLVFLILKIVGGDGSIKLFRSKMKFVNTTYEMGDENIEKANFPGLIEQAILAKNHTLVIRYYYLYALQVLSEKNVIEYHIRKTNSIYIQELHGHLSSSSFIEIASLFEYIWYGNYSAEPSHCDRISEKMKTLKQSLI